MGVQGRSAQKKTRSQNPPSLAMQGKGKTATNQPHHHHAASSLEMPATSMGATSANRWPDANKPDPSRESSLGSAPQLPSVGL